MRTVLAAGLAAAAATALSGCVHDNPNGMPTWDQYGRADPARIAGGRGLHDSYRRTPTGTERDSDRNMVLSDMNGIDRRGEVLHYVIRSEKEFREKVAEAQNPTPKPSGPGEVFEKGPPKRPDSQD